MGEIPSEYLDAIAVAMHRAKVVPHSLGSLAARLLTEAPKDVDAYLAAAKEAEPWRFLPAASPEEPYTPDMHAAELITHVVKDTYFLHHLEEIAGSDAPAPVETKAAPPPTTIARSDPHFGKLFAAHAELIASGKVQVLP